MFELQTLLEDLKKDSTLPTRQPDNLQATPSSTIKQMLGSQPDIYPTNPPTHPVYSGKVPSKTYKNLLGAEPDTSPTPVRLSGKKPDNPQGGKNGVQDSEAAQTPVSGVGLLSGRLPDTQSCVLNDKKLTLSGCRVDSVCVESQHDPATLLRLAFHQALEGHRHLLLEVIEPDGTHKSRMLTREQVEEIVDWVAGKRWRLLDPETIQPHKPPEAQPALLEG